MSSWSERGTKQQEDEEEMSLIAKNIKGLLSVKIKARHDSYTDQYNRIFMVKLLLVSSLVMGVNWYHDSLNCVVPDTHATYEDFVKFVSSTCWVQGVYVFKELRRRADEVAYYGIPRDINQNGLLYGSQLCRVTDEYYRGHQSCVAMQKTFFLQYQWLPFFIASLAIMFYVPYIIFRSVNNDLINLKATLKRPTSTAEKIAESFFHDEIGTTKSATIRIIFNVLIKIAYIVANLVALFGCDQVLNGEFLQYGQKWIQWANLNNTIAYDYMGLRNFPKPGNELLPPFGYCELYESSKDIKQTFFNKHTLVCELSQNILYQYSFVVLWFAFVFGIVISLTGLVLLVLHYIYQYLSARNEQSKFKGVKRKLRFRQLEFLDTIGGCDKVLHKEVLYALNRKFFGTGSSSKMEDGTN